MSSYSVLIVDDSVNVVKSLVRTFKPEGYITYTASSPDEALQVLKEEKIDVLITDENMPGATGTDLLLTIKSIFPDMVKIMITGATDIEVAKNAINTGDIYKFFTKPWDNYELLLSVQRALEKKELEIEVKKLRKIVEEQRKTLKKLENEHPGISEMQLDDDGCIVID